MEQNRNLNDLHPEFRALALKHIAACKAEGIVLLIYDTYRSNAEQDEAYAVGRFGDKRRKITNSRGGTSKHNNVDKAGNPAALAYDCVGMLHGKPQWADDAMYLKIGQLAEGLGLTWAGRWTGSLREKCHIQMGA